MALNHRVVGRAVNFVGRYTHAVALAAYTFTIGLASARRRALISQLARAANYRERPRPRLPAVLLSQLTKETTPVGLPNAEGNEGEVSLLELVTIARLVRERAPRELFEIGTFNGRTTLVLATNAPDGARVHTLDLPPDQPARLDLVSKERRFVEKERAGILVLGSGYENSVQQHYGDSATFDFSSFAVDFVFVDGSHAYEYVMNDSVRALSMLRGGRGLILWHDYGEWEGVTRALNELLQHDDRFAHLRHVRNTTLAVLER